MIKNFARLLERFTESVKQLPALKTSIPELTEPPTHLSYIPTQLVCFKYKKMFMLQSDLA
jgi:hypothetical protein